MSHGAATGLRYQSCRSYSNARLLKGGLARSNLSRVRSRGRRAIRNFDDTRSQRPAGQRSTLMQSTRAAGSARFTGAVECLGPAYEAIRSSSSAPSAKAVAITALLDIQSDSATGFDAK